MHVDARGLTLSIASAKAAAAFDHLVTGYLTYRADTPARLTAPLDVDPDFALAKSREAYSLSKTEFVTCVLERALDEGYPSYRRDGAEPVAS